MKLLSYQERKARIINLDSDLVLIKGKNHVGKSCILKSLYRGLGAEIKKIPESWDKANIIILLYFTIDNVNFKSLLVGNDLYVFNPDESIRFKIKVANSKGNELLNSFFGIKMSQLNTGMPYIAAGAMYMPFYIDQDAGWSEPWSSFVKIGNISEKTNVRQFLTTIVDETYFSKKKELATVESKLYKVTSELKTYNAIACDVKKQFKQLDVATTVEDFQKKINEYLEKLKQLREEQKDVMRLLQTLYTKKAYLELTIKQLQKHIKDMKKDFNYAIELDSIITCPTCGCQYCNDMLSRHEIKEDEHECKNMIISYQQELDESNSQIVKATESSDKLSEQIIEAQSIINASQNNITLEEVIESKLRERMLNVVSDKKDDLHQQSSSLFQKKRSLEAIVKGYENSERKVLIESEFKEKVESALRAMGLSKLPNNIHFGGKISTTGSTLPLSIIAYSFAYFYIMQKYKSPLFFPIVVDEPKQQGLQNEGLRFLINYMLENLPERGQLILSLANEDIELRNNALTIDLDKTKKVLIESDYVSVKEEVEKLLEKDFFNSSNE